MEEFNSASFYKRVIQKGGNSFTYIKVKTALSGNPETTSDKEKKQLLAVLDDIYRKAKENILKS
jgi:hypothetical protein